MADKRFPWLLGILFPLIAYSCIFISISLAPWFSWYNNALSDLGVYQRTAIIFNCGLVVSGLLYFLYSIHLITTIKNLYGRLGAGLLVLDALSLSLVGVFPENLGVIHSFFAVLYFLIFPFAYILFVISSIKGREHVLIPFSFLIGALIGFSIWFIPWRSFGIKGLAIPEIIGSLGNIAPLVTYSIYKLTKKSY
ncbi:MAG: DUF998 domain-containing protein [Candidatus Njordarchaeales archaeon]